MLEKAAENMSFSSQSSLVLRVIGKSIQPQRLSTATPEQVDLSELSEDSDSNSEDEQSANETMRAGTPPVVFDDEEAWESCSQSSLSDTTDNNNNPLASSVEELGHPLVASTPPVKGKLVTNNLMHNSNVQSLSELTKSLKPEIPAQVVVTASQEVQETKNVAHPTTTELSQKAIVSVPAPSLPSPPTSNLVKRLFCNLDPEKHVTATSTSSVIKGVSVCLFAYLSVCLSVCDELFVRVLYMMAVSYRRISKDY